MLNINELINSIATFDEIEFAYLFGSYATDKATKNSDIDIAIFIKKDYNILYTVY